MGLIRALAVAPKQGAHGGSVVMLATLCGAVFLTTGAGTSLAPFLLSMALDLRTDLAATANLVAILIVPWGVLSPLAGAVSDRLGRRPIIVGGLVVVGISQIGVALATDYSSVAAWELLSGIGGGSFMGTVLAAVSDRVDLEERGRALGWIVAGQSLSLVLGVPLVTFIGAFGGWRAALAAQGVAMLLATVLVWLVVAPLSVQPGAQRARPASPERLLNRGLIAILLAVVTERACFSSLAVYLATYLLTSYGVTLQELAGGLLLVALGNLLGNLLGSQSADRLPARPLLFAGSSVLTGLLALPLLIEQPGLAASLGLGFAFALANGFGRPVLLASLSEVPSDVRGAVLGLNITSASLGWAVATVTGGFLVTRLGFGALGLFTTGIAFAGAVLAALAWLWGRQTSIPSSAAVGEG